MFEKIDVCYEALRFTPFVGFIDICLIIHFFYSWFRSARKTGWTLDFWYLILFISIIQWLCILYPFNSSIYNDIKALGNLDRIDPLVDKAFLIGVLGYVFIWVGRYVFDLSRGRFVIFRVFQ